MPRVLIVDDEALIADTVALVVAEGGFLTRAVYSGTEALEEASRFRPQVMITDIFMPGMDGVETAIQLREVLPSCRVLLLSGHIKAFEYVESARQRGYDFELLRKPAHPREVVAKVKELAARPQ